MSWINIGGSINCYNRYLYSNGRYDVAITSEFEAITSRKAAELIDEALEGYNLTHAKSKKFQYITADGKFHVNISFNGKQFINVVEAAQQLSIDKDEDEKDEVEDIVEEVESDLEDADDAMTEFNNNLRDVNRSLKHAGKELQKLSSSAIGISQKVEKNLELKFKRVRNKLNQVQKNLKDNVELIDKNLQELSTAKINN